MKKSDILSRDWLSRSEFEFNGEKWVIRELPMSVKQHLAISVTKMDADGVDPREATIWYIEELCFASVIDDDGELVFATEEEKRQGKDMLSDGWYTAARAAIDELNGIKLDFSEPEPEPDTTGEQKKEAAAKKKRGKTG